MPAVTLKHLQQALKKIDRPGTFCVSGSAPALLPGLEVNGLGPVGLPLTAAQAKELKKHCEQAPYGKGEETLVDTSVRNVWRLQPEHFALKNPAWETYLKDTVKQVQKELGLEKQKLESHLYELLLYEPGSFFLPHRDGEKLDRMVATLVVVLPSSFEGGELVVRHEGQEQVIDFGGDDAFHLHHAAFYADCEHEIRPLTNGYRLCLVYNLTLAKTKKPIAAPRRGDAVAEVAGLLREWAKGDAAGKLVITLDHEYTAQGVAWDGLKGADRAKAQVLADAARQADCQVYLALLTFHESGSAEGNYGYGHRGRWHDDEEDEPGHHEMGEVFEEDLSAEHWSDPDGNPLPVAMLPIDEEDLLDPDALKAIEPEEDFEGYTGNAGMTLDRWYRHAAIILWPNREHFEVVCGAGNRFASEALKLHVKKWQEAGKKDADRLRQECSAFATAILARWQVQPHSYAYGAEKEPDPLSQALAAIDEPDLVKRYLREIVAKDPSVEPAKVLRKACEKHGWDTFRPDFEAVFANTTDQTLERNVRLLEQICTAGPRKDKEWAALCQALAQTTVEAVETIDRAKPPEDHWRRREPHRVKVLTGLARSFLAGEQSERFDRLVTHVLALPAKYPLVEVHVAALLDLESWLEANVKKPDAALAHWLAACCGQLEGLTAEMPQPPADHRRPADVACKCADCAALSRFLADPNEPVYRFRAVQGRRSHLEDIIKRSKCDLDLATDRKGSPHTLVGTKNTASYRARLMKYRNDQERLAALRSIEAKLPG